MARRPGLLAAGGRVEGGGGGGGRRSRRRSRTRSNLTRIGFGCFVFDYLTESCWPTHPSLELGTRMGSMHTTLLLALPAEKVRQVLRLQVGSSETKVQVVFVISLDVSVIPSN